MNLVKATLFDADREFPQRDSVLFCVDALRRLATHALLLFFGDCRTG